MAGLALGLGTLAALIGCGPVASPTAGPPTATAAPLTGAQIYQRNCSVCHPGGQRAAGPAIVHTPLSDAQLADVIRHGKANMPGYDATRIPDSDLQLLIAYIRTLK